VLKSNRDKIEKLKLQWNFLHKVYKTIQREGLGNAKSIAESFSKLSKLINKINPQIKLRDSQSEA
jgi:hypothetical protein